MLKVGSKRRRPAGEVNASRDETRAKEDEIAKRLAEIKAKEQELHLHRNDLRNGKEAMQILNGMLKAGQIRQSKDGTWSAVIPSDAMQQ